MGSLFRAVNQLWLKFIHPNLLAVGVFLNPNVFTFLYLLSWFVLLLKQPHHFLPQNVKWALFNCGFTTIISVISLTGLIVYSIFFAVNDDGDDCPTYKAIGPLFGWDAIGNISAIRSLRLVLPPIILFISSLYMTVVLKKESVFILPPVIPTDVTQLDTITKKRIYFSNKSKSTYLAKLEPELHLSTGSSAAILILLFVCGCAYSSALSGVYFFLFLAAVLSIITLGGTRHLLANTWFPLLFYSMLHILWFFLYQFSSFGRLMYEGTGNLDFFSCEESDSPVALCQHTFGYTGILGLYRYTCFNSNVKQNWFIPIGYGCTFILFTLLCFIHSQRVVVKQLLSEGFTFPAPVTPKIGSQFSAGQAIYPFSSPASSPAPSPSSVAPSYPPTPPPSPHSQSGLSNRLSEDASSPLTESPKPSYSSVDDPLGLSRPSFSRQGSAARPLFPPAARSFSVPALKLSLSRQCAEVNMTGNQVYDNQLSAPFLKVFFGRNGYIIAFLGILFLAIFLPSLLIYPLLFVVLFSPLIPPMWLYHIQPFMLVYLLLFECAQYIYNIPSVGQLDPTICQEGTDCFQCGWACILENLGLRSYVYGEKEDICDLTPSDTITTLTFPFLALQSIASIILACCIRFRIRPDVSKKLIEKMLDVQRSTGEIISTQTIRPLSVREYSGDEHHDGQLEESDAAFRRNLKAKISEKMNSCWNTPILTRIRSETKTFFLICLKRSYGFSLVSLYICGLSEISLLNSVYIFFFLFYILFPQWRKPTWPFFVGYTAVVLSVLTVWQVTWTVPYDCSLVGLRHYSSFIHPNEENNCYECQGNDCIWDLWKGAFWHVVIFITGVAQLFLDRALDAYQQSVERSKLAESLLVSRQLSSFRLDGSSTEKDKEREEREPPQQLSHFSSEIPKETEEESVIIIQESLVGDFVKYLENSYAEYGLLLVYATLLLVATLTNSQGDDAFDAESIGQDCETSHQTSIINVIYICFLFVCLNIHHLVAGAKAMLRNVMVVALPFFVFIFLASYLCQWTPFFEQVMVPFQRNHGSTDFFAWIGLVPYIETNPDIISGYDPRCCRLADNTDSVCGYLASNYFIDWKVIIGLAPRAAVVVVVAWQVQALFEDEVKEKIEVTKSPKSRVYRFFVTLYSYIRNAFLLHTHKLAIIAMFTVAILDITLVNLVLLVFSTISLALQNGPDHYSFLLLILLEMVVLFQFGFRFICRESIEFRTVPQWFGFSTHNDLWGDIIGYILVIVSLVVLRIVVRTVDRQKSTRGFGTFGEITPLIPTKTRGYFADGTITSTISPDDGLGEKEKEKEKEKEEEGGMELLVEEIPEQAEKKGFDLTQSLVESKKLLFDTFGWYISNIFRIHCYGLLHFTLLLVVFSKIDLFALFYFAFFCWSFFSGKWKTMRYCSFFLFFVCVCVVLQYFLLLQIPRNVDELAGNIDCDSEDPTNNTSGLQEFLGTIKCWLHDLAIVYLHFLSFCYKKGELFGDMYLCLVLGMIVRQNRLFPHVGREVGLEELGSSSASLSKSYPSIQSDTESGKNEETPLVQDNFSLYGDEKEGEREKEIEVEDELIVSLEEIVPVVRLYRDPFSLSDEELKEQDTLTVTNLFLDAGRDFTSPPQSPLDVFKHMVLVSSKTLITIIVLIMGTAQANLVSCGYVAMSVMFWYFDEAVSREGNRIWRYLVRYNIVVLAVIIIYQPLLLILSLAVGGWDNLQDRQSLNLIMEKAIGLQSFLVCKDSNCARSEPCVNPASGDVDSYKIVSFDSGGMILLIFIFILLNLQTCVYDSMDWKRVRANAIEGRAKALQKSEGKEKKRADERDIRFQKLEESQQHRRAVLEQLRQSRVEKVRFLKGLSVPTLPDADKLDQLELDHELKEGEDSHLQTEETIEEKKKKRMTRIGEIVEEEIESTAKNPFLKERRPENFVEEEDEEGVVSKVKRVVGGGISSFVHSVYRVGRKREIQEGESLFLCFLAGVAGICQNNSHIFVYSMMVVNQIGNYDIISLFYPLSAFAYAAVEYRKPPTAYWRIVMLYCSATIIVKFFASIIGNSVLDSSNDPLLHCDGNEGQAVSWLVLPLGIKTLDAEHSDFLGSILYDTILFLSFLWHRHNLKREGSWWAKRDGTDAEISQKLMEKASTLRAFPSMKGLPPKQTSSPAITDESPSSSSSPLPSSSSSSTTIPREEGEHHVILGEVGEGERREGEEMGPMMRIVEREEGEREGEREGEEDEGMGVRSLFSELSEDYSDLSAFEDAEEEEEAHPVGEEKPEIKERLLKLKEKAMTYYEGILARKSPGEDFYTRELAIEVLCFIFLVFFQQDFTGVTASELGNFIESNRIPRNFLFLVFMQFCLIIWGRIIYLKRAMLAKLVTQYVLLVIFHIVLIFWLPASKGSYGTCPPGQVHLNGETVPTKTWAVVVFYFLKCGYFWACALQLRTGFPVVAEQKTLYKSVSIPAYIAFQIYYAVPFLYEMRTVLDWAVFPTTLDLYQFLKLEDVYVQLYCATYYADRRNSEKRYLGDPQPQFIKILVGFGLFFLLVLLIWFPLFLMSSANPANIPNSVNSTSLRVSIVGWEPLYANFFDNPDLVVDSDEFQALRCVFTLFNDDRQSTQDIEYLPYSEVPWEITPPSRESLLESVMNCSTDPKSPLTISVEASFFHAIQGENVVRTLVDMSQEACQNLSAILQFKATYFEVPNLWPRGVRLPASGNPSFLRSNTDDVESSADARISYVTSEQMIPNPENPSENVTEYIEYWNVEQISEPYNACYKKSGCNCGTNGGTPYVLFNSTGPEIITVSAEVLTGIAGTLATAGIVGLYVGVVLAVSRFLRLAVSNLYLKIPYEDMPDPSEIMNQCEFIYAARQTGDLDLEEELFWELIELYRSTEEIKFRSDPKKEKTD